MDTAEIKQYLGELNDELRAVDVKGEICLYGGAVMCLVYDARPATKDVDAVFRPTRELRQAVERVAVAHGLPNDWLNDAVKGYVVPHPQRILFDFPCLKVYVPEADYLLAMKVLAARVDTMDVSDVRLLIGRLGLQNPAEVFAVLEKYYPRRQIKPATQYFIEELFEQ
ncbi:MAG: hypothetical protein QOG71_2589 [Pyrinomonadaceae bacterium]|nr:hypothetical protein [Pyrinomonadaceae bacterium]